MNKTARSDIEQHLRPPPVGAAPAPIRNRKATWVPPETPVSVRFEPEMIRRLDRVAQRLSTVNSNIRVGRSSVVKLALDRSLAAIEAELSITRD